MSCPKTGSEVSSLIMHWAGQRGAEDSAWSTLKGKPGSHRAPSHTGIARSEAWVTHEYDLSLRRGLLKGSFSIAYPTRTVSSRLGFLIPPRVLPPPP